jgi:hypothetical protein
MDLSILVVLSAGILLLIVVGTLTERGIVAAADSISGLFSRAAFQLSWPVGVQEDDDAHWGWAPPQATDEPELIDTTPRR